MTEMLSDHENDVLIAMDSSEEYCIDYKGLEYSTHLERTELQKIIKHLKELSYINFWRGLMTEDGEVAGSGWCRSRTGNEYVEEHQL